MLTSIYQYVVICLVVALLGLGAAYYTQGNSLDKALVDLKLAEADKKLLEIQRDALTNAVTTQSDAISKISVLEERNHKVYAERTVELSRSLDKERLRVRDLNGTQDCVETSKIIQRIVDADHTI
jgi:hypothetical protein